jgi:hypothetical protein
LTIEWEHVSRWHNTGPKSRHLPQWNAYSQWRHPWCYPYKMDWQSDNPLSCTFSLSQS